MRFCVSWCLPPITKELAMLKMSLRGSEEHFNKFHTKIILAAFNLCVGSNINYSVSSAHKAVLKSSSCEILQTARNKLQDATS